MSSTSKLKAPSKFISKKMLIPASTANVVIKGSVEKLQRSLDVIRGLPLRQAMNFLFFTKYGANADIAKLIKSAAANAISLGTVQSGEIAKLFVSKVWAVKNLEYRRFKAGPRGRARPIRRRLSKIFIELGTEEI